MAVAGNGAAVPGASAADASRQGLADITGHVIQLNLSPSVLSLIGHL
jgi:hypothetical protein